MQLVHCHVAEFLGCWAVGGQATLTLNTTNGATTISFTTTLPGHPGAPLHHSTSLPAGHTQHQRPGHPGPPLHPTTPTPGLRPRPHRRGPAQRERDRLRAARHQATQAKVHTTPPPVAAAPVAQSTPETPPTPIPAARHQATQAKVYTTPPPVAAAPVAQSIPETPPTPIPQYDGAKEEETSDEASEPEPEPDDNPGEDEDDHPSPTPTNPQCTNGPWNVHPSLREGCVQLSGDPDTGLYRDADGVLRWN